MPDGSWLRRLLRCVESAQLKQSLKPQHTNEKSRVAMKKFLSLLLVTAALITPAYAADHAAAAPKYNLGNENQAQLRSTDIGGKQVQHVITVDTNGNAVSGAAQPAGENHIGQVGGHTATPAGSAAVTRPADTTAYASGDLVANSTTAGSVAFGTVEVARVSGGSGMIRKIRLSKSSTGTTNASFRIHFFTAAPTVANGDNGAFVPSTVATYLGACDVTSMIAFGDGAAGNGAPVIGSEINFDLAAGTTIVWAIEARAAYTPASAEAFTLRAVEVLQN